MESNKENLEEIRKILAQQAVGRKTNSREDARQNRQGSLGL
jgi:hypothetical protein